MDNKKVSYKINKIAYKEQLEFLKLLEAEIRETLGFYGLTINEYIYTTEGLEKSSIFLQNAIDEGKLNNWINDEIENNRIQPPVQINIFYFMKSFANNNYVESIGGYYDSDENFFTLEELRKLDAYSGSYMHTNYTPVNFYESHNNNDDGSSIFSLSDSSRKLMHAGEMPVCDSTARLIEEDLHLRHKSKFKVKQS